MPLEAGQAFFWALYGHKEPKPPKLLIITQALCRVLFQCPEGCLSSLILLLKFSFLPFLQTFAIRSRVDVWNNYG